MLDPMLSFAFGFAGSMAVELVAFCAALQAEPFKVPHRYRHPLFWLVRVLVAVVGGSLAIAYEIRSPLPAINIGAATPLIIQALTRGDETLK
ncbi:MAG: hypothetical protein ABSH05_21520 [Bryobacteraceae bacterium]|jgi:hypothetical protein